MNVTSIPAPRVPFIDEHTGLISREWYRFFLNLFTLTGSGTTDASWTDLQIAPATQPVMVDVDLQGMGSVCPVCQGVTPSDDPALQVLPAYPVPTDDAALVPGTPEQRVQDLIIPPYPEQTPFDVLAPMNPVGFTQRVESLMSDVQGLTLAPPVIYPGTSTRRGGMRKTSTIQNIGSLGGSWVSITNYDADGFTATGGSGVSTALAAGTLTVSAPGDYVVIVNITATFDGVAATRIYGMQVYDTIAAAIVPNVGGIVVIPPSETYDMFTISLPVVISAAQINHPLIVQIGTGSSFTNFAVVNATFAMYSVGPV